MPTILFFIFSFILSQSCSFAQNDNPAFGLFASGINKLYSPNEQFFIARVTYADWTGGRGGCNCTAKVYASKDTLHPLYTLAHQYLEYCYLSNNGMDVFYFAPNHMDKKISLYVFHEGKLVTQDDTLIPLETEEGIEQGAYSVYYSTSNRYVMPAMLNAYRSITDSSRQSQLFETYRFSFKGDTVCLITKDKIMYWYSTTEQRIIEKKPASIGIDEVVQTFSLPVGVALRADKQVKAPTYKTISLGNILAKQLKMVIADGRPNDEERTTYRWYKVFFDYEFIPRQRKLAIRSTFSDLDSTKIRKILQSIEFDPVQWHPYFDKYLFSYYGFFRKKSDKQSKKDRVKQREAEWTIYKQNIEKDSLAGIYIPKDLKDAFCTLDQQLSHVLKDAIKNLNERAIVHMTVGTSLRNDWGLWKGSRLKKYFLERGIFHPDEMSGIILRFYKNWLNHDPWPYEKWITEHLIIKKM